MQDLRKHITRVIVFLLALQVLNLSVYAPGFKQLYSTNNTEATTNITETTVEYVVEVIMGIKNAIPEQLQHHKDLHFHKQISFKTECTPFFYHLPDLQVKSGKAAISLQDAYDYLFLQEINPPPPKPADFPCFLLAH